MRSNKLKEWEEVTRMPGHLRILPTENSKKYVNTASNSKGRSTNVRNEP